MGASASKRKHRKKDLSVAEALAADDDPIAQAFVQRRTSLNEEQFKAFLTVKDASNSSGHGTSWDSGKDIGSMQSMDRKAGNFAVREGPIQLNRKLSNVPSFWDLWQADAAEAASSIKKQRRPTSVFGLPLISPLSKPYKIWASLILMLDLTYVAFLIPILVGFEVPDIGWGWGCIVNLVCGGLYFIDTCLGFHVGFLGKYNMNKKLVMDGRAIAWYYTTRGNFYVDVITVVAWTAQIILIILDSAGVSLGGTGVQSLYQIIRALRLIRFVSLMQTLYATAVVVGSAIFPGLSLHRQYAYFVNLIYGGLAILNFLSCLVNFMVFKEGCTNTWLNHFYPYIRDYGGAASQSGSLLTQDDCAAVPFAARWLAGAYWMLVTMLSIGYGDISPMNNTEILVVMFCMIGGIVFFGILLGSISEAITELSKDHKRIARFRTRMEAVDKWMSKRSLPKGLRQRIAHYYQDEWVRDAEAVEEVVIMEELPQALRREVSHNVNRKVFQRLRLFHDFPPREQVAIASMMTPIQLPAGAPMCDRGDVADCIWILHEGSVSELGPNLEETKVHTAPALLGEAALLQDLDTPDAEQHHFRPCGLRTRQMSLLWVVPLRNLLPLLRAQPTLFHRAVRQAMPHLSVDYLKFSPLTMESYGVGPGVHPARTDAGHGQAMPHTGQQQQHPHGSFHAGARGDGGPASASHRDSSEGHRHAQDAGGHDHDGAQHGGMLQHVPRGSGMLGGKPSWLAVRDRHMGSMRLAREEGRSGKSMGGKQARLAK